MRLKFIWFSGLMAFMLLAGILLYGSVPASADTNSPACGANPPNGPYGRSYRCTYFTNMPAPADGHNGYELGWIMLAIGRANYTGITPDWSTTPITLSSFITGFQTRLFDTTSQVDEARAAALVDIMLGKNGPDFNGSVNAGIAFAQANWANWVNRVTAYASNTYPGYSVNFNEYVNFADISATDGMGLVQHDNNANTCNSPVICGPDIGIVDASDPTPDFAVVFNFPGGQFIIKDKCGNLQGDITSLPSPIPPVTISCAGLTTSVDSPNPNQPFTVNTAVRYSPNDAAAAAFGPDKIVITLTGPVPYVALSKTVTSPSLANGIATASLNVPATNVSGTFAASWQVVGAQSPTTSCSDTVNVVYQSYFDIVGGDVSAGEGFGPNCADDPDASIIGENDDSGTGARNYFGASSRQGAIATGQITQFATDTTNSYVDNIGESTDGLSADQPSGLTFANNPPVANSYGGNFLGADSALQWCQPNYATTLATSTTLKTLPTTAGFDALTNSGSSYTYTVSGDQTLGGFTLQPGVHVTIIVTDGDVYIDGNILYSAYASLSQIPQFRLIVDNGNITMRSQAPPNPAVTELHGLYVAQPNIATDANGDIFTCASGLGADSALTLYGDCDQPLVIYGAVSAKEINLGRTYGNVTLGGSVSDYPAEQFVYTPELWLSNMSTMGSTPTCADDPEQTECLYQSYATLPPVL